MMNIWYFFVTDRISAKELNVEYCPTLDMIADYLTKPLQGSQFREFRNTILGIDEINIPNGRVPILGGVRSDILVVFF